MDISKLETRDEFLVYRASKYTENEIKISKASYYDFDRSYRMIMIGIKLNSYSYDLNIKDNFVCANSIDHEKYANINMYNYLIYKFKINDKI